MFYKLKTDLPNYKAGDLFYLDQNGNLCHKETGIIAYQHYTLKKFPDALEKFWEPIEEESKRWRAEDGAIYYYVDSDTDVLSSYDDRYPLDNGNYRYGNYFQTREEAQALADYIQALAVVRDDAKGFKPDWLDDGQLKFYVYYWHKEECLFVNKVWRSADNGVFGLPYFKTRQDAEASIDKHRAEWLTIFGVKDETEGDNE